MGCPRRPVRSDSFGLSCPPPTALGGTQHRVASRPVPGLGSRSLCPSRGGAKVGSEVPAGLVYSGHSQALLPASQPGSTGSSLWDARRLRNAGGGGGRVSSPGPGGRLSAGRPAAVRGGGRAKASLLRAAPAPGSPGEPLRSAPSFPSLSGVGAGAGEGRGGGQGDPLSWVRSTGSPRVYSSPGPRNADGPAAPPSQEEDCSAGLPVPFRETSCLALISEARQRLHRGSLLSLGRSSCLGVEGHRFQTFQETTCTNRGAGKAASLSCGSYSAIQALLFSTCRK